MLCYIIRAVEWLKERPLRAYTTHLHVPRLAVDVVVGTTPRDRRPSSTLTCSWLRLAAARCGRFSVPMLASPSTCRLTCMRTQLAASLLLQTPQNVEL